jgi:predicted MFS family arabinose efflux permease
VSSLLVKPLAGWGADRYGRRPLMIAGTYYTAVELGIAAGAIGFGILLARTSFPFVFSAAAAPAIAGAGLAVVRRPRP